MDHEKNSSLFRALGEPVRLRILERLTGGELCACDLLENLDISQPTLSHHMKVLLETGLVEGRRQGIWVHYSIRREAVEDLKSVVSELVPASIDTGKSCCE